MYKVQIENSVARIFDGGTEINSFRIDDGTICNPGKFEGEPISTYLLYQSAEESGHNEECTGLGWHAKFEFSTASAEDKQEYLLEQGVVGCIISEDSSGFVYCETYEDAAQFENAWSEYVDEATCEDDGGVA
jgi:hypothetical protein